jgi:ABC-type antimicrobial peptide transport system permease subunit
MPSNPLSDPNWAPQLADTIERVVGQVRDKTTKPVVMITRGLVFGLLGVFVGVFALVVVVIGLLRGVQAIIEWPFSHPTAVWVSYLLVGGLFCLVGAFCMSKRNSKEAS